LDQEGLTRQIAAFQMASQNSTVRRTRRSAYRRYGSGEGCRTGHWTKTAAMAQKNLVTHVSMAIACVFPKPNHLRGQAMICVISVLQPVRRRCSHGGNRWLRSVGACVHVEELASGASYHPQTARRARRIPQARKMTSRYDAWANRIGGAHLFRGIGMPTKLGRSHGLSTSDLGNRHESSTPLDRCSKAAQSVVIVLSESR